MKSWCLRLVQSNLWANEIMADWIRDAGDEACAQHIPGSFPSVRETLLHIYNAQEIWLSRLDGNSPLNWVTQNADWPASEIAPKLIRSSQSLCLWAEKADEAIFNQSIDYRSLKGDPYSNTVSEILSHVVNHSTFHRGQVVNMLRTLGFTQFSSTDLIAFFRLD